MESLSHIKSCYIEHRRPITHGIGIASSITIALLLRRISVRAPGPMVLAAVPLVIASGWAEFRSGIFRAEPSTHSPSESPGVFSTVPSTGTGIPAGSVGLTTSTQAAMSSTRTHSPAPLLFEEPLDATSDLERITAFLELAANEARPVHRHGHDYHQILFKQNGVAIVHRGQEWDQYMVIYMDLLERVEAIMRSGEEARKTMVEEIRQYRATPVIPDINGDVSGQFDFAS